MVNIEIQIYSKDDPEVSRNLHPKCILQGVSWEELEQGGMGQATIPLAARFEADDCTLSPIEEDDTVHIWVNGEEHPRYIGRVTEIQRTLATTETITLFCYGELERMNSIQMPRKQIPMPGEADLAAFAQVLLDDYNAKRGTSFEGDFVETGITQEMLRLDDCSARAAFDKLFEIGAGAVVWGWEVNPANGEVRCYLRPRTQTIAWQKTVGNGVVMLGERSAVSEIFNALTPLKGGPADFPNTLGEVVQDASGNPNTSFERPEPAGDSSNVLKNPSFLFNLINPAIDWTTAGDCGQNGIAGRTDGMGLEISGGGSVTQWNYNVAGSTGNAYRIIPGHVYRAGAWSRIGIGDGKRIIVTLQWRDASGTQIGTDQVDAFWPNTAIWRKNPKVGAAPGGMDATAPPGATGYTLKFEGDDAPGTGTGTTYIDDAFLIDVSAYKQPGWKALPRGATNAIVDWAYDAEAYHGQYCVYVDATGVVDADEEDFSILPISGRAVVLPGQKVVIGCWYKSHPDATSTPKLRLRYAPKGANGGNAGPGFFGVDALYFDVDADPAPTTEWKLLGGVFYAFGDFINTASIEYSIIMRSSGKILFDAAGVRDQADSGFIEGDVFERNVKATEVCDVGSDAYNSEADYGLRETSIAFEGITAWNESAIGKVKPWFEKNAILLPPRELALDSEVEHITPATGHQLHINGVDESLSLQWPVIVSYLWKGKLSLNVQLGDPKPDLTKQIVGGGETSASGGGSAGGGGGGVTAPASLESLGAPPAKWPQIDIDDDYTITSCYVYVRADATAGDIIVTLPDAEAFLGQELHIAKIDVSGNSVTVVAASGDSLEIPDTPDDWSVLDDRRDYLRLCAVWLGGSSYGWELA